MNVQRLTEAEQNTNEWEQQMKDYDKLLANNIDAKKTSLSMDDVPDWNRLSINELDPDFDQEFNKVISDDDIPDADQDSSDPINIHEMTNDGILNLFPSVGLKSYMSLKDNRICRKLGNKQLVNL